jgi:hypothetical protein
MSKQLVNEIHCGFRDFLDQQDHTHPMSEIPEILARNLDDTVLDCGLELDGKHASPHSISNLMIAHARFLLAICSRLTASFTGGLGNLTEPRQK